MYETLLRATSFPAKVALGLKLQSRLARVRLNRRKQLRQMLRSATASDTRCPICNSGRTVQFAFDRPECRVEKCFCRKCEHLFTEFLQTDPAFASDMFKFAEENPGKATQVLLLTELAGRSGLPHGVFLDFGVGANVAAFQEAAALMPQHRFMGCDVFQSNVHNYFETYGATPPFGKLDGISSYAVIEHLTETIETWTRLNRLLKPMSDGGGLMVHSFPSQLHHDFDHWAVQILNHTCVFSRKSLRLTCEASGFRIERADPPRVVGPHDHPVVVFRKSRDV